MGLKVHLTFLWTDESVMLEDFGKKVSKKMLEWAKEFYTPYGIELDVKPAPNVGTVALAHKFALVKNDGVQPNLDLAEVIREEFQKRREKIEQERAAVEREDRRIHAEIDALPLMDTTNRDRLYKELDQLLEQTKKLNAQWFATFTDEDAEVIRRDYDTQLRLQMTDKFIFDKIGGRETLNVVFAKFQYRYPIMSPRHPGWVPGITRMFPFYHPVVFAPGGIPRWVWPYTYILLDIGRNPHPRNLAHELVHTVGESHPDPQKVIKNLEKLVNFRPPKPEGSLLNRMLTKAMGILEYQSLFKEVDGGYFDGPENDIMNYSADFPDPSDYILHDTDKARFFKPAWPFITNP
jgi:hypothetical protein